MSEFKQRLPGAKRNEWLMYHEAANLEGDQVSLYNLVVS